MHFSDPHPDNSASCISDLDFFNAENAWQAHQFNTRNDNLTYLFDSDQGGVRFTRDCMVQLVSTVGLYKVKFRFGEVGGHFEVMLYGVDSSERRLTPYFGSEYVTLEEVRSGDEWQEGSEIPNRVVSEWKSNWKEALEQRNIRLPDFNTPYGFLQGYNYLIDPVIASLFPVHSTVNDIMLCFGLHKYQDPTTLPHVTNYTFGLILTSQLSEKSVSSSKSEPTNAYYDLTMPCPPTC